MFKQSLSRFDLESRIGSTSYEELESLDDEEEELLLLLFSSESSELLSSSSLASLDEHDAF